MNWHCSTPTADLNIDNTVSCLYDINRLKLLNLNKTITIINLSPHRQADRASQNFTASVDPGQFFFRFFLMIRENLAETRNLFVNFILFFYNSHRIIKWNFSSVINFLSVTTSLSLPPNLLEKKKREVNIDLDRKPANSKNIKIFWSRLEIYRETSKTLKHHQFEPIWL